MAVYYVAKTGNDTTGNGSEANPWLTIQKGVTTIVAGDTLYVKDGTYNEWVEFPRSGTSENPIVVQSYTSLGAVVDGTGLDIPSSPYWKALFYSAGNSYITIDGFEVVNSDEVLIRLRAADSTSARVNGLIVQNCKVHGNSAVVRNGIDLMWCDNSLVENNEAYDTGWNAISLTSCNNTPVKGNTVHNNTEHAAINIFPSTSETPQGIYDGNDIINNICVNTGAPGTAVYLRQQRGNLIAGNMIAGYQTGLMFADGEGETGQYYQSNSVIANNTIADGAYYGFRNMNATHVTVVNNIFAYNSDRDVAFETGTTTGSSVDYNLYYDTPRFKWGATSYTDLATWVAATGQDVHSLDSDPGFTNRAADDYTLLETSPAIDAGTDVSAYDDIDIDLIGVARPQGDGYDLGAYEFDSIEVPTGEGSMTAPTITTLPTAPSRTRPTTFSAEMDAFLAALQTFATEVEAAGNYAADEALAAEETTLIGWKFASSTTMADPGSGYFRFNNATLASVTQISVDDVNTAGKNIANFVTSWAGSTSTNKGTLIVWQRASGAYTIFTVTGLTDESGYTVIDVTYVAGGGTYSADGLCGVSFNRAGNTPATFSLDGTVLTITSL